MKNKVFITILLAVIIIFAVQLSAYAVVISTDKAVESGSGTVTISVTANQALGAYNLKLTDTAGLTLVSATGGAVGVVSSDNKTISGASDTGVTSLGTFTFNVPTVQQDTKYNIKFSITGMETPSFDSIANETNTAVITVKAPVIEPDPAPQNPTTPTEPQQPPKQDPKPETSVEEKPNFTNTNKKMYATKDNMNLRETWSTNSSATPVNKGTELTVTGTSSNKVNGYVWYRVSYNGKTLYVASNLLTDTKPAEEQTNQPAKDPQPEKPTAITQESDANEKLAQAKTGLKSLEITGLTLSPTFSPNVYEYRVIVKEDLGELPINAIAELEDSSITIAGNDNLAEGENLITILVYNEKRAEASTYQITVNKATIDLSLTDKILQAGNNEATRNLIIFMAVIAITIIALIVVTILRGKNKEYEDDYNEENNENYENREEQSTEIEQTMENAEQEIEKTENIQDEALQEERSRRRHEKRKGKHF